MFIILFICVILSAFFSCVETAFSSVNTVRLRNSAENGNKRAKTAIYVIDKYDKAITAVLIGNNIVNLGGSSLATVLCIDIFGDIGAAVATGATTLIILTFGEIIPKCFAKQKADSIALATAGVLKTLIFALYPLIMLFSAIKTAALKLVKTDVPEPSVTEDELRFIVESIEEEGVLEKQESEMVQSALAFDEKNASFVMTPRVDMTAIDINGDPQTIEKIVINERYSRIPVYSDNLDHIVGILHSRDYLEKLAAHQDIALASLIQPAFFVYKSQKLSALLAEFKKNKLHIAVVTDEFGGTLGIVTMEDLLEEIVGEIWDEDEEIENNILKIAQDEYLISPDIPFANLLKLFGIERHGFENQSVGKFMIEHLDEIPQKGTTLDFENILLTVSEMSDQRIIWVKAKKIS